MKKYEEATTYNEGILLNEKMAFNKRTNASKEPDPERVKEILEVTRKAAVELVSAFYSPEHKKPRILKLDASQMNGPTLTNEGS